MSKVHHYLFIDIDNICKVLHLSISRKKKGTLNQFFQEPPNTGSDCVQASADILLSESVVSFKLKIHLGLTELTKAPL